MSATLVLLAALGAPQAAAEPRADAREALLARCVECHASQVESYARTGMARALEPLRPGELAGLAPVAEPGTGFTYSFEQGEGRARIVETFADPAGGAPRRDSHPLAFAIGAGVLDRSYAVERSARLWFAPLEVVGSGARRRAALAPPHAITPGARFSVPITPECLGCHTDSPPPLDWPLNRAPSGWEPRGISCAACHGELEEHVRVRDAAVAGAAGEGGASGGTPDPDPLLAERDASRVARMERCAACHLQGDARVELDPGRVGPPPPWTPLLESRAVFVAREAGPEIGFVSHVERLVLSRCYLESADLPGGGLSCESCHDPHRAPFEPAERRRVRDACLACHGDAPDAHASACALGEAERPAERDCASCHMRRTGVFDVADVEIHDHWIRRAPPPPSPRAPLRFPESPSGDWRVFAWPDAPAPAHADDPGPWTMALAHRGHVERARERLAQGLGARARDLPMLHHVRGSLLEQAGDAAGARASYERALALDPELAASATNLAPLLARAGEGARAKALLDELIRRHPLADGAYRNRGVVRLELGDEAGFLADLETAMKLLPDPTLALALAKFREQSGDAAGARRWREEAKRLDPRVP